MPSAVASQPYSKVLGKPEVIVTAERIRLPGLARGRPTMMRSRNY
jgi:hypothetical protein